MISLLRTWFYKVRHSTLIYLCFILVAVCATSFVVVANKIATGDLSASTGASAALLTDVIISSSIFGPLLAANFLCRDFEARDLHVAIRRRHGRLNYVISKAIVLVVIEWVIILPYVLMTVIPYLLNWNFVEPYVSSQFLTMLFQLSSNQIQDANLLSLLCRLLVILIVFSAQASVSLPFAFAIKKPVPVAAICIVIPFVLNMVTGIGKENKAVGYLFKFTPFNPEAAFITLDTKTSALILALFSSVLFVAIMIGISYLIFRKAEIK